MKVVRSSGTLASNGNRKAALPRLMPLMAVAFVLACSDDPIDKLDRDVANARARQEASRSMVKSTAFDRPKGDYEAIAHARGVNQVPSSQISGPAIPCGSDAEIAKALWSHSLSGLNPRANASMTDFGVDDVALKDGVGKVAAIVYRFAPGDPGVISRAAHVYLLDDDCETLFWSYVDL